MAATLTLLLQDGAVSIRNQLGAHALRVFDIGERSQLHAKQLVIRCRRRHKCGILLLLERVDQRIRVFLLADRGDLHKIPGSRHGRRRIGGSAVDIEVQADDLRHTVDTVLGLIAEDTGQPVERIFDDSLHDHWYTAAEARDYGFIDGIVDSFGQVMPARKHRIGLKGEAA